MLAREVLFNVGRKLCGCEVIAGCSWRYSSVSSTSKNDFRKAVAHVKEAKDLEDEEKFSLFRRQDSPTSLAFVNPRGIENYDPEMRIKDIIAAAPEVFKENTQMLRQEWKEKLEFTLDKKEVEEQLGWLRQGETRKEYVFDTPEAFKLWRTGCDSDEGYGYSRCELVPTDRKTAIFRGKLSTQVVKDGKHERSGWASMKLHDVRSFGRKKFFSRWASFSHLLIKCRGDGRSYKVMLHCPGAIDVTWGDSFSYPLHTHGGPYWQYEKIPFSKFFHTVEGRIQDRQFPVHCALVSSMGIVLMDRMDGEFSLELDFIGVSHDRSHLERFAYESYTIPLANPSGF